jgi:uncharacterized protein (TIGR02757 family)
MTITKYREIFDGLYTRYNRREFVHPDPLEFLYKYEEPSDREICGLVSSSLAYGRVAQILKSVNVVLEKMTPSPSKFLRDSTPKSLNANFYNFKHRFTTGEELALTLLSVKNTIEKFGSLEVCFISGFEKSKRADNKTILSALLNFTRELNTPFNGRSNSLVPSFEKRSAMKRLNLFLRWMVRSDAVDPGGWTGVNPSDLLIPLDTHMHKISLSMGFTKRKQSDIKTVIEVTDALRQISPNDPIKYDFVLTRFGIRDELNREDLISVVSDV